MAFPVSAAVREAYLGSHEMELVVTVFRGSENLGTIPVTDSYVSASYGTQGGRDAGLVVNQSIIDRGLLNPLSDQVRIEVGIPNLVRVPLFTGRVDETSTREDGEVNVQLLSRGGEAIRASFEVPWAAGPAGTPAYGEMARILQSIDMFWGVDYTRANGNVIPAGLVWEDSVGQALDQLAQGASLIWQPDRVGSFVIYTNPWTIGSILGYESVVTLTDGQDGVLVSVQNNTSRIGVYNSVTVVTERVSNTPPVRVTAKDQTPGSPTFWGGLFGKQNLVIKNQTPDTQVEAAFLAARVLRQSLSLQRSFSVSVPDMPLLDPGDVFTLWYQDVVYTLVVETVDYSTSASSSTRITARELMLNTDIELT